MDWPDPFPGASLEAAGNGSPRKMIVQRQNPAYRSAYIVFFDGNDLRAGLPASGRFALRIVMPDRGDPAVRKKWNEYLQS